MMVPDSLDLSCHCRKTHSPHNVAVLSPLCAAALLGQLLQAPAEMRRGFPSLNKNWGALPSKCIVAQAVDWGGSVFSPPGKEDEGTAANIWGHLENQQITTAYCGKKYISFSPGLLKTNEFDANQLL